MRKNVILLLFLSILVCLIWSCQQDSKTDLNLNSIPTELEVFGSGIISTALYERDIAIAPKGDEIIYTLGDYKQSRRCLVKIKKSQNGWTTPIVLNISGIHQDIEPFYSDDGQVLYFASDRPLNDRDEADDYNIWKSQRDGDVWSDPVPLGPNVNSENDEYYPSVSNKGTIFFTSSRPEGIGREDIFFCEKINGEYQPPQPLDTMINTPFFEFNAFVNPDENLLIFGSFGRPDGHGGGDLYFSKKDQDGNWTKSQNMGELVNSDKLDYCPFIDINNNIFYFTSERSHEWKERINSVEELKELANKPQNGMGNIYRISMSELGL